jgi:hypothetical protein
MIVDHEDVDEILWGGQAGGGKSEGLLMFALKRRIECPGSVGLMLRRSFPELDRTLIRKSMRYFKPYAKWNESKRKWVFKEQFGGSIQEFGYSENDRDVEQFQSVEYDDICFDELTHFSQYQYGYMKSRLRTANDWKTVMRSASNPGGKGHAWVKAYFVDFALDKVYEDWDEDEGSYKTRLFLPATLDDNTMMPEKQRAQYRSWLSKLPEAQRKMLRDGDWDYIPGAAFAEWDRKIHVIQPIPVPSYAKIVGSFDYGFGKPFSMGWWWIDYDGRLYRFAEWYGWNGEADKGLRLATPRLAQGIKKREQELGIHERIYDRIADPSIFSRTPNIHGGGQGPSVAEVMSDHGIDFSPGDNDRIFGKQQFHERLAVPEDGSLPMVLIYENCDHFIRTVPVMALDEKDVEDVDTDQEDHVYDEARYLFMSRPLKPTQGRIKPTKAQEIMAQVQRPVIRDGELSEIF